MRVRTSAAGGVARAVPCTSSAPPPGSPALAVRRAAERPVASMPSATIRSCRISKRLCWPGRGSKTVASPVASIRPVSRPSRDRPLVSVKWSAGTVKSEASIPRRRATTSAMRACPSRPTPPSASMVASTTAPTVARSSTMTVSGGRYRLARVASASRRLTRAVPWNGRRAMPDASSESGAPATWAVRRRRPRGSGFSLESASASTPSPAARQVRTGVSVRSSNRIAPSVTARWSRVNGRPFDCEGGRASRSEMLSSPCPMRTMWMRGLVRATSAISRCPRSRRAGWKRTSSRSNSTSGGPGMRSARRNPAMERWPWRRSRSRSARVRRRPVWASTCHTSAQRAMRGSASQSAVTERTSPASTTAATLHQRRRRVTIPVCIGRRSGTYRPASDGPPALSGTRGRSPR